MTIKPPSYFKHLCPPTFFKKSGAHHTKHPIISSRWWLQNYSHPWHPWHLQLLSRGLRPQLDIELSWSWLWRRNAQRQCAVWIVRVFHIVMLHQFVLLWFHFINYRSIHIHTTPTHTHIHTYIYIYIYIHTHRYICIHSICAIHIWIHLHIMSFNAGFLPRQPCEKLPKPIHKLPPHSAEVRESLQLAMLPICQSCFSSLRLKFCINRRNMTATVHINDSHLPSFPRLPHCSTWATCFFEKSHPPKNGPPCMGQQYKQISKTVNTDECPHDFENEQILSNF